MYAFLRRPAWVLSHVLVAALVVAMVGLGFWQRSRWIEERHEKERLDALATATPEPIDDVLPPGADHGDLDAEALRHRRVELRGTYDPDGEVVVLNRSQGGAPGGWLLTPLVRPDGDVVPVVRGWIPYDMAQGEPPFADARPPEGEVQVVGSLQPTQRRGSFGPSDPEDGRLTRLNRVDLERLDEQYHRDLAPMWVLLEAQEPEQSGTLPALVELERGDPTQNFSYMVQWWIFAAIAAGGYPLVLRAVARSRARGGAEPDTAPEGDLVTEA